MSVRLTLSQSHLRLGRSDSGLGFYRATRADRLARAKRDVVEPNEPSGVHFAQRILPLSPANENCTIALSEPAGLRLMVPLGDQIRHRHQRALIPRFRKFRDDLPRLVGESLRPLFHALDAPIFLQ